MAPRTSRLTLAGLLGKLAVGCGGESDLTTSSTDAVTTSTPAAGRTAATPNVEQYLLQVDEGPGLEPMSSPQTDSRNPSTRPSTSARGRGGGSRREGGRPIDFGSEGVKRLLLRDAPVEKI